MSPQHIGLLERIELFEIDAPGTVYTFAQRLAKENDWTLETARRAIREYKRFAYLAMVAGHPVTPSDAVDQVWHLHLCYTRSYWEQFCGKVLGSPLHHEPTQGGSQEKQKHTSQYGETLSSYRRIFDEEPPTEFWPPVEIAFGKPSESVRINRDEVWLLPKPRFTPSVIGVLFLSLFLIGCTPLIGSQALLGASGIDGPTFLFGYSVLVIVFWLIVARMRSIARKPNRESAIPTEFERDPSFLYERAYLVGGAGRVVDTVLIELIQREKLNFDPATKTFEVRVPGSEYGCGFERDALEAVAVSSTVTSVRAALFSRAEQFREPLENYGVLSDEEAAKNVRRRSFYMGLVLFLGGILQLIAATQNQQPFGYLIIALVVVFISWLAAANWRPTRNRYGDALVESMRAKHAEARRVSSNVGMNGDFSMALLVSLYGMSMLHGTQYDSLAKGIAPHQGAPDGGGCSSSGCSSGSGGDGSGCTGGCGGCGGGGD